MNQPVPRHEDAGPPSLTFPSGLSWMRVRTPRLLSRIGKGFFLLGGLGMLAMVTPSLGVLAAANLIGAFGWLLFLVSYVLSLAHTSFGGALSISKEELAILTGTKRTTIPLAKIAGALVVNRPVAGGMVPTVEIELVNGDRLTARMPDPTGPGAVVRSLGFGTGGRRVQVTLSKPTRRLLHPLFGFASYVVGLTAVTLIGAALPVGEHGFEAAYAAYPPVALLLYAKHWKRSPAPRTTWSSKKRCSDCSAEDQQSAPFGMQAMWPQHAEQYLPDGQPVVVQSAGGGGGASFSHLPGRSGCMPVWSQE
jgi:hypothetical protein